MATVKVIVPPPVPQPPARVQVELSIEEAATIIALLGTTMKSDLDEKLKSSSYSYGWAKIANPGLMYKLYVDFLYTTQEYLK